MAALRPRPRSPARRGAGNRGTGNRRPAPQSRGSRLRRRVAAAAAARSRARRASRSARRRTAMRTVRMSCVVWRPLSLARVTSATAASTPGTSAFVSELLPTPDCPTSTLVSPARRSRSALDAVRRAACWHARRRIRCASSPRAPPRAGRRRPARSHLFATTQAASPFHSAAARYRSQRPKSGVGTGASTATICVRLAATGSANAARVDAGQQVPPRQDFDDDARAALGRRRRPVHAVAADDGQPPALEPAVHAASGIVHDRRVATVAGDDAAVARRAAVAAGCSCEPVRREPRDARERRRVGGVERRVERIRRQRRGVVAVQLHQRVRERCRVGVLGGEAVGRELVAAREQRGRAAAGRTGTRARRPRTAAAACAGLLPSTPSAGWNHGSPRRARRAGRSPRTRPRATARAGAPRAGGGSDRVRARAPPAAPPGASAATSVSKNTMRLLRPRPVK